MAACQSVKGCHRVAETSVPAFMGVVQLCGPCARERAADGPSRPSHVGVGSYVAVRSNGHVGVVDHVTSGGWYVVACWIKGKMIVHYRARGGISPV